MHRLPLISAVAFSANPLQDGAGVLDEVGLAGLGLGEAGVEAHDALGGAVGGDVDVDGVLDDVPRDALEAGRGGQGTLVLEDRGVLEVVLEQGEVEGAGLAGAAGGGDGVDVQEDAAEEEVALEEATDLDGEADDGKRTVCEVDVSGC